MSTTQQQLDTLENYYDRWVGAIDLQVVSLTELDSAAEAIALELEYDEGMRETPPCTHPRAPSRGDADTRFDHEGRLLMVVHAAQIRTGKPLTVWRCACGTLEVGTPENPYPTQPRKHWPAHLHEWTPVTQAEADAFADIVDEAHEITVIRTAFEALNELDGEARHRALSWIFDRFGFVQVPAQHDAAPEPGEPEPDEPRVAPKQERRERLQEMWRAGLTSGEIAREFGWQPSSVGVEVSRMRRDGWDMPYRRPSASERTQQP